jgi:hypothetical protein
MNDKQKVATAIIATALAVGGGGALASGHNGGSSKSTATTASSKSDSHLGPLSVAATYLGLTTDALRTQLGAGKSLADVATAQSKSVSGLEDALLANLQTDLDADVTAGRITSDRETQILANAKTQIAAQVARKGGAGRPGGFGGPGVHGAGGGLQHAAAQYLGLTDAQLLTQLQAGKSLADVATAQGKTAAGLKAALVTQFSSTLDAYVNATHTGGSGPGFGGPGGGPGFGGGSHNGFRLGGGFRRHP